MRDERRHGRRVHDEVSEEVGWNVAGGVPSAEALRWRIARRRRRHATDLGAFGVALCRAKVLSTTLGVDLDAVATSVSAEIYDRNCHDDEKNAADDADDDHCVLNARRVLRDLGAGHLVEAVPAANDTVADLRLSVARPIAATLRRALATSHTPLLIATVSAVPLSVAMQVERDALSAQARETGRARRARRFVRSILAVHLPVALPRQRNAEIRSGRAGELVGGTRHRQDARLPINVQDETDRAGTACRAVLVPQA